MAGPSPAPALSYRTSPGGFVNPPQVWKPAPLKGIKSHGQRPSTSSRKLLILSGRLWPAFWLGRKTTGIKSRNPCPYGHGWRSRCDQPCP